MSVFLIAGRWTVWTKIVFCFPLLWRSSVVQVLRDHQIGGETNRSRAPQHGPWGAERLSGWVRKCKADLSATKFLRSSYKSSDLLFDCLIFRFGDTAWHPSQQMSGKMEILERDFRVHIKVHEQKARPDGRYWMLLVEWNVAWNAPGPKSGVRAQGGQTASERHREQRPAERVPWPHQIILEKSLGLGPTPSHGEAWTKPIRFCSFFCSCDSKRLGFSVFWPGKFKGGRCTRSSSSKWTRLGWGAMKALKQSETS